jgi:hypothetical protein
MMIPPELEQWLKNSIGGIVLLGAVGSLLAVVLGRVLMALATRILPAPFRAYRKQSEKQAYFMGYVHATIHHDKTGRMMPALLAFRLARFVAALALFLFAAILASNVLVFQAQVVLTVGVFVSVAVAFLALYWAYFEFEWVYRTYLWLWRTTVEAAQEGYEERHTLKESGTQKAEARDDES